MKKLFLLVLLFAQFQLFSQTSPFQIKLEAIEFKELGGLHSFAFAQHDGKWLIVGGRLDGLHRRQPFAAFDQDGNNILLWVIDPIAKKKWTATLALLPIGIQEQLSSSNMQFHQKGNFLYCTGGYGFSKTIGNHTTYPNLTAINVSETIKAIIENKVLKPHFLQITDSIFQVTGGKLKTIDNNFYLVGGHKFIGRYNPMGADHGPGFEQNYTNSARIFSIQNDDSTLTFKLIKTIVSDHLHRRDFNVESKILPNGKEAINAFSGVFQPDMDLPFLSSIQITENGMQENRKFQQYYNHYHSAVLPLYSEKSKEMHTVFFGGIAQFYDSVGTMVQDNDVPFTKTIARVSENEKGEMSEYKLPIEMPSYMGAAAEFIPNLQNAHYRNEVLKLDELKENTVLGYIYGGINSKEANIFWVNEGEHSTANPVIYKVILSNNLQGKAHVLNEQSNSKLKLEVYPNPFDQMFMIRFMIEEASDVKLVLKNAKGKTVWTQTFTNTQKGLNAHSKKIKNLDKGGNYFIQLESKDEKVYRKIVVGL